MIQNILFKNVKTMDINFFIQNYHYLLGGGLPNFCDLWNGYFYSNEGNGCNVVVDWENAIDFFECFRVWILNVKIALKYH